jgi:hypothetical protein
MNISDILPALADPAAEDIEDPDHPGSEPVFAIRPVATHGSNDQIHEGSGHTR